MADCIESEALGRFYRPPSSRLEKGASRNGALSFLAPILFRYENSWEFLFDMKN